jgi:hypothetical protein
MKDDPFHSGAPKPVDVEAIACEERRLVNELGISETSFKEVCEKTRAWFCKVSELLAAHANGQQAISPALAMSLWQVISPLSVGKVHRAVEYAAAGSGQRQKTPLEHLDKQAAVDYIAFAKVGKVAASDAVGEIAKAYGVARRTVQSWVHDIHASPDICDAPAAAVIHRASVGATRFRAGGRSKAAILSRNSKNKKRR